jgi:hypothetical protein
MRVGGPPDGAGVPGDVPALFAAVAGIGPFFAVATGAPPAGGGWVSLRVLVGEPAGDDPLTARIATVREALGTDARVAASTVFQALAAQLVAPLLAAAAVVGALPVVDSVPVGPAARNGVVPPRPPGPAAGRRGTVLDAVHWRPGGAGPGLWWAADGRVVACPDAAALGDVLIGLLAPLVAAVRARASVAERVLWGDAASAVASARTLVAAARPRAAARATALAEHLLTTPPLAATAALRAPEPPDRSWTFRRRSCCLYYRVPGGGVCADCVLLDRRPRPPPRRR